MKRIRPLILSIFTIICTLSCLVLCGGYYINWWLSARSVITPAAKRDIVYQRYTTPSLERTLELGFINANGAGEYVQAVLSYGVYAHNVQGYVAEAPFGIYPYFGFLVDSRPYVQDGGELVLVRLPEWKRTPCKYRLRWRPYPVGTSGAWVGEYQWAKEGGILLFWPDRPGCPKKDLWSRQELKALGILRRAHSLDEVGFIRVTAFHHQNSVLIFGREIYRWDFATHQLESWGRWIPKCAYGELSYDDAYLACITADEAGLRLQIWNLQNRQLWRERLIRVAWVPQYGIELSWAPTGTYLVYHRCVEPDLHRYPACELKGEENLGIYLWDLERDEERLLIRHGVMPFWLKWEE